MNRLRLGILISLGAHAVLLGAMSMVSGDLRPDYEPPRMLMDRGEMAVTVWLVPPDYADQSIQPEPDLQAPQAPVQTAHAPRTARPVSEASLPQDVTAAADLPSPHRQVETPALPAASSANPCQTLSTTPVVLPKIPLELPEGATFEMPIRKPATPVIASSPEDTGVRQGVELAHMPEPEYPAACIRDGQEGLVVVEAMIRADGSVGRAHVYQSSRWPQLDAAAVDAVRAARFIPARQGGTTIAASIRVPVRFVLEGG